MKDYKKVEIAAKNAPSGSYAAGCPADKYENGGGGGTGSCQRCERTR